MSEGADLVRRGGVPKKVAGQVTAVGKPDAAAVQVAANLLADTDPGVRDFAVLLLAGAGEPGVVEAERSLRAALAERKADAAGAVLKLGDPGRPAVERALADPDTLVRRAMLTALKTCTPPYPSVGPRLAGMLTTEKDNDNLARAIDALARYPDELGGAKLALEGLMQSADLSTRMAAFSTLCQALTPTFRQPTALVGRAVWLLTDDRGRDPTDLSGPVRSDISAERRLSSADDWNHLVVKAGARRAGSLFGEQGVRLLTLLYEKSPNETAQRDLVYALAEVAVVECAPLFRTALRSRSGMVRREAARGLGQLGPAARDALAELRAALAAATDPAERSALQAAINRINGKE